MRKLFLIIALVFATVFTASSQEISKNAIGIRFGDSNGLGGGNFLSSLIGYGSRLEIDLGLRSKSDGDSLKQLGFFNEFGL